MTTRGSRAAVRVLLTGWPSFLHGEATAGDVLSMERVQRALTSAGVPCEVAWSPVFRPGTLHLDAADPARYTHVIFASGPAHGAQLRWLHDRFDRCARIAVGVSVVDPADPAVTGFDAVLPRDTPAGDGRRDLASGPASPALPVVGVVLAPGQAEYGARRRHDVVHEALARWLIAQDCARVPVDTRLDTRDWRSAATPAQLDALLARLDAVVTTRLHGLVLALRHGVPALAVDPVAGGGKVTAQAQAWDWPAVVAADDDVATGLARWWPWCCGHEGRELASARAADPPDGALLDGMLAALALR